MSTDVYTDPFNLDVTLVNGDIAFGGDWWGTTRNTQAEINRWLSFVLASDPDHEWPTCSGHITSRDLVERYIRPGNVRPPVSVAELEAHLRQNGRIP